MQVIPQKVASYRPALSIVASDARPTTWATITVQSSGIPGETKKINGVRFKGMRWLAASGLPSLVFLLDLT